MKIVGTDNHARETVADVLWLDRIPDNDPVLRMQMQRVCDKLNEPLKHREEGRYYAIKEDGYRLSRGMEDFV
jgi:transcription initiation factor IIE alpha subunit